MMRRSRVVLLVSAAALTGACGSDSPSSPPDNRNTAVDVFTVNVAFSPSLVQLSAGDTVRFNITTAADGDGHDVTFDPAPGAPPNIPVTSSGIIARVFTAAGTFRYNCFVHPGMSGEVDVR